MRIALGVEYDGSDFAGWQWQTGCRTVQSELEKAIGRVANTPIRVMVAGRTDSGVHATGQVAHFDTDVYRKPYSWLMGVNSELPKDIRVLWVREVDHLFHARYSAIARYYRYIILNRPMRSALARDQLTWVPGPLNEDWMQKGALCLVGEHDFSSFRAQGCQSKSPNRLMHFLKVSRDEDRVMIDLCANAFVHHMVRNIAGVLIDVGLGKQSPDWVGEVLSRRDRTQGGVTAPPDGLYFAGVCYPESFGLPRHPVFEFLKPGARRYSPPDSV